MKDAKLAHIAACINKVSGDLAVELDGRGDGWVGVAGVQVQEPDARLAAATLQCSVGECTGSGRTRMEAARQLGGMRDQQARRTPSVTAACRTGRPSAANSWNTNRSLKDRRLPIVHVRVIVAHKSERDVGSRSLSLLCLLKLIKKLEIARCMARKQGRARGKAECRWRSS